MKPVSVVNEVEQCLNCAHCSNTVLKTTFKQCCSAVKTSRALSTIFHPFLLFLALATTISQGYGLAGLPFSTGKQLPSLILGMKVNACPLNMSMGLFSLSSYLT